MVTATAEDGKAAHGADSLVGEPFYVLHDEPKEMYVPPVVHELPGFSRSSLVPAPATDWRALQGSPESPGR